MSENIVQLTADEYADLSRRAGRAEPKANPLVSAVLWLIGLMLLAVLALNIASAMGWYTPPAWQQAEVHPTVLTLPTAAVTLPPAPVQPQVVPIYVQQPVDAPPPAVAVPAPAPEPAAPGQPALPAPRVETVYIQSTGGSTVATGSGTNDASGGPSTGVCALAKGARRCGK